MIDTPGVIALMYHLLRITHHAELIGSLSVTTRNMYSTQVISLNNKLAMRIRKPVEEDEEKNR